MFYKNKIVRDLHQCITSPYVLNDNLALPLEFLEIDNQLLENWLQQLDKSPKGIDTFIEEHHSKRLGRYFENLLHYYFAFHPNIEILEVGKQVFKGKITLGEMDFILKNKKTQEIIHLETAVKYFAKEIDKSDFRHFICPNGTRNFGDKLDKTFGKQLRITELIETQEFLKSSGYLPIKSYHFIKGILFYHPSELKNFKHEGLNIKHLKSWWIYQNETSTLNEESKYRVVHKLKWLSPEIEENTKELLTKSELIELLNTHFEIISQGQLIIEYYYAKPNWIEKSRGFVLDNNWPTLTML
jgi:hypothetical protein